MSGKGEVKVRVAGLHCSIAARITLQMRRRLMPCILHNTGHTLYGPQRRTRSTVVLHQDKGEMGIMIKSAGFHLLLDGLTLFSNLQERVLYPAHRWL
jgi:hypothetical protein